MKKKNHHLIFLRDLKQSAQCHLLITSYDASFSILRGFEGKEGWGFLYRLLRDLSQSRVIIHSRLAVRDDVLVTFSLRCFVVADPRQERIVRAQHPLFPPLAFARCTPDLTGEESK